MLHNIKYFDIILKVLVMRMKIYDISHMIVKIFKKNSGNIDQQAFFLD